MIDILILLWCQILFNLGRALANVNTERITLLLVPKVYEDVPRIMLKKAEIII